MASAVSGLERDDADDASRFREGRSVLGCIANAGSVRHEYVIQTLKPVSKPSSHIVSQSLTIGLTPRDACFAIAADQVFQSLQLVRSDPLILQEIHQKLRPRAPKIPFEQ